MSIIHIKVDYILKLKESFNMFAINFIFTALKKIY